MVTLTFVGGPPATAARRWGGCSHWSATPRRSRSFPRRPAWARHTGGLAALEPERGLEPCVPLAGGQPGQAEQVLGGAEQAQVVEVAARGRARGGVRGHHDRGKIGRAHV